MGAWLAREAGRVICAEHGAEALEILSANKIDLLVSDIRMPVMDGIALVKKMRKTGLKPRVILVTGFKDTAVPDAYTLGVDAIVEKPFDRGQLLRTMQHCLEDVVRLDA
jgi:two-component system response regulator YesN